MLGDEVWIENAPGGPVGTIVFGVHDDHVGLSAPRRGGAEIPLRTLDSLMLSYRNGAQLIRNLKLSRHDPSLHKFGT